MGLTGGETAFQTGKAEPRLFFLETTESALKRLTGKNLLLFASNPSEPRRTPVTPI